jgi:hypothetical protein
MAALFLGGVAVFFAARLLLVPKDFGLLGHYRPGALADIAARPPAFAGRAACADCHADVIEKQKGSRHAAVGCEACHGALAKHAGDPAAQTPAKLADRGKDLCLTCHAANVAKPKGFKQIDKSHGDGAACSACHGGHAPEKGPA